MHTHEDFLLSDIIDFVFGIDTDKTKRLGIARKECDILEGFVLGVESYRDELHTREAVEDHIKDMMERALILAESIKKKIDREYYLAQNN